ncbi:MAG TPA: head GIN domain-containing protein [Parafilimonas sp.]|nr:head GIN domain-containing protein [Parafilimonas sp.]
MKRIMSSLLFLFCSFLVVAQKQGTIEPSGNIITRDVTINSFNSIKADGLYELVLTQGDKESVKIEADDNLQNLFKVSNDGSTLVIDMPELKNSNINFNDENHEHKLNLKVYVTFKQLNAIDVGIIGTIRCTTPLKADAFKIDSKNVGNIELQLTADKLTINNKGVGNITLTGSANNAIITNAGVGKFNGEDLIVQTMDINNSGVGNADVHVEKDLKVKESFLGKVTNSGNAKEHKMDGVEI